MKHCIGRVFSAVAMYCDPEDVHQNLFFLCFLLLNPEDSLVNLVCSIYIQRTPEGGSPY